MGGQLGKLSETPKPTLDPLVETLNKDILVPRREGHTTIFGTEAPNTDAKYLTMVYPDEFAQATGDPVYYRIPGDAFGVCRGRSGDKVVLLVTWPKRNHYVSVSEEHLELIREEDVVNHVKPPSDIKRSSGFAAYSSLPPETRVTFLDGSKRTMEMLPGGLQRVINLCYFKSH
jgi:hypothetical protein